MYVYICIQYIYIYTHIIISLSLSLSLSLYIYIYTHIFVFLLGRDPAFGGVRVVGGVNRRGAARLLYYTILHCDTPMSYDCVIVLY